MKRLLVLLALIAPWPVAAAPAPGEVWINEIFPNPVGSDTGQEWLEILNRSLVEQDLSGLSLQRVSGQSLGTIPAGTLLQPSGVWLWKSLSGSLLNSGDQLALVAAGQEIDQVNYDTAPEGRSWSRTSQTTGVWMEQPTPGEPGPPPVVSPTPNLTPPPTPTPVPSPSPSPSGSPRPSPPEVRRLQSGEVWLNELLPDPLGTDNGHEWVELYNTTNQPLQFGGLKVVRESGSVRATVPDDTEIAPGGYLQLPAAGSIVNGGDTVNLVDAGTILDTIEYGAAPEGQSWIRLTAELGDWTATPTPGAANIHTSETEPTVQEPPPAPAAVSKATAKPATKAKTNAKSAAKSTKKTSNNKKLPSSGPGLAVYRVSLLLATLYAYRRWKK